MGSIKLNKGKIYIVVVQQEILEKIIWLIDHDWGMLIT
jgi:hypothetical protein